MSLSFRTNGNFIDFVNTDATSLQVETVLMSLHNTSRAVSWSLPTDTTKINFTIDEIKYSNIPISEIDFDGTVMNSQDDFETGITGMFTGLAGGGSGGGVESVVAGSGIGVDATDPANPIVSATGGGGYLVAEVELTDAQIKNLDSDYIEVAPAPGNGKIIVPLQYIIKNNLSVGYSDVDPSATLAIVYGDWEDDASQYMAVSNFLGDTSQRMGMLVNFQSGTLTQVNPKNVSGLENLPLKIVLDNGSHLSGGDSSNTVTVSVKYTIEDL